MHDYHNGFFLFKQKIAKYIVFTLKLEKSLPLEVVDPSNFFTYFFQLKPLPKFFK